MFTFLKIGFGKYLNSAFLTPKNYEACIFPFINQLLMWTLLPSPSVSTLSLLTARVRVGVGLVVSVLLRGKEADQVGKEQMVTLEDGELAGLLKKCISP